MNKQNIKNHSAKFHRTLTFLALAIGIPMAGSAGDLNLSDNALEVVTGVEPNIMIITDDSGSMDFNLMTVETEGQAHLGTWNYGYTHPDPGSPGSDSTMPATNYYDWDSTSGWGGDAQHGVIPTEEYLEGEGLAAPQGGVWRYWNSSYNFIYYNPDVTYTPWEGLDINGNAFSNASSTAAPYNPYRPGDGTLNLTSTISYDTDCGLTGCQAIASLDGEGNTVTVTGFYPARYYTWPDTNSTTPANAGNGVADDDDDHTLVEIKSTTPTYTGRLAYTESSGKGRSDCKGNADPTTCTYTQEIQNFANWFSYYRKRDLIAKAAFSNAIEPAETARIGYATINNNASNAIGVDTMNVSPASGSKKTLLDKLFVTRPFGGTPLRTSLANTGKYFDCTSGNIVNGNSSSPGDSDCPVEAAPAGQCQQNYAILMTDGYWNGSSPSVGNVDDDGGDFAGGAFSDGHSDTLADVAMKYYKTDLHALSDDVATTTRDISRYLGATDPFETMHQHMATYTVSFGVDGTLSDPSDPSASFSWPDPTASGATLEKIDDLRHAAYNGRGQFLSATNPVGLADAMEDIFSEIETATGTATAVAFNTQEVEAGTLVFRASFNTKTNKGDLVAQQVNPDGTVDSAILWSAAEQLDNKVTSTSDSRVIITYKDTGGSASTGRAFQWGDLYVDQQTLLNTPQPANKTPVAAYGVFGDERVGYLRGHDKLGDIVHSTPVFVGKPPFLNRNTSAYPPLMSGGVPVAGSIPYADFQTAQENRTELTYVGANDGMLHAFDTSNGSELFAYVPNIVVENLSDLTDPAYSHQYYVDLRPSINDAYFTPLRGTNASTLSWNTVLMGGLAGGGKGYYALNITAPGDFSTETNAKTNVMWEFTEADDGGVGSSDLGYSFSEPLIAMTNSDDGSGNKEWWAIFGNGYNSTTTGATGGQSVLYMVRLEGGQDGVWTYGTDYRKISTGFGLAQATADATLPDTPNGISGVRGIDTDHNGTVDYVYAGDLQGNLFRFDFTSTNSASWGTQKLLFQAKYSTNANQRDAAGTGTEQPITSRPIVIKHPSEAGYIVILATGSWMTTGDATSTGIQSIYGVWDDMLLGTASTPDIELIQANKYLVEQEFTNQVSIEHGFTVRTLSDNTVNWNTKKGWHIDLDVPPAGSATGVEYPGERAVRNLQIRGGILFVNTIIPKDTNACSVGAGGFELAFNPVTGGSGSTTIFDLDGNSIFDDSDNAGDLAGDSNIITGIRFDTDTPTDSAFIGSRRMTQEGDTIRSFDTNTGGGSGTGRTSWRQVTN
jgi:type IV pilus assembly protein PilY1